MKTFTVYQTSLCEKKACVTIEAENGKKAIEKARALQWEDFEQTETLEQIQWKLGTPCSMNFFERLLFLFTGDQN